MSETCHALIVDDQATNRLLAGALLRRLGWTVHEAADGATALALAARQPCRLVLLDISMPGLSGEETCQRLRRQPGGRSLRIVAYTAHAQEENRVALLAAGFDEVLVKPIDRLRLIAAIGKA